MRSKLTYSNVMATVAVFLSLGAGAYAVGIGRNDVKSRHIADDTIKSRDVKDKSLRGRDLREETLTFKEIREDRLDVSQFAKIDSASGSCQPGSTDFVACSSLTIGADQTSRLLVVATGGQRSIGGPSRSQCRVVTDGVPIAAGSAFPGESGNTTTGLRAENGFSITGVSDRVGKGPHSVVVECNRESGTPNLRTNLSALILDAT